MYTKFLFISLSLILFIAVSVKVSKNLYTDNRISVILLTVESLRHDMVNKENCPKLLKAAEDAVQFTDHRAISGWTGTNIVSLLTGLTPFKSGVHTRGQSIKESIDVPLESLRRTGYRVEGIQPFMAMDLYKNLGLSLAPSRSDPLVWLAKEAGQTPFFFWYHYVDTHLPYQSGKVLLEKHPLSKTISSDIKKIIQQPSIHLDEAHFEKNDIEIIHDLQGVSIQEFDSWFDKFFSFLQQGGLLRNTILLVTADHGEEHGERGMTGHASTTLAGHLHEEIVKVPLFIWVPAKIDRYPRANLDSTIRSSHIDIMATLTELLDIPFSSNLEGRNLFKQSPPPATQTWSGMTSSGGFSEPDPLNIRYFEYSHIDGVWKSRLRIHNKGQTEFFLYNLEADPGESTDYSNDFPTIRQHHKKILLDKSKIAQENLRSNIRQLKSQKKTSPPVWKKPSGSRSLSYDSINGAFAIEWQGSISKNYTVEYRAGTGRKQTIGTLEVLGSRKDFGTIPRSYWNKWIVPLGEVSLRVQEKNSSSWSKWITISVEP